VTGFHISRLNNFSTFSTSFYHRVNSEFEAAGRAVWDKKSGSNVSIEVGAKYALDKDTFAKVL
jgi:hypothetical protein